MRKRIVEKDDVDVLSQLPDGILVDILSHLPIDEAARTSILSTRWRYLWTFFFGILSFESSLSRADLFRRTDSQNQILRANFIGRVNEVMNSLRSPTIKGLKISFELGHGFDVDVYSWVQFAIQKKVQNLDLYFGNRADYAISFNLSPTTSFDSLCSLHLRQVSLNGDMVEYLVSCCPHLETLSLNVTIVSETIKVSGSSLKLKHLDFIRCRCLEGIEISAGNLESFTYVGHYSDIAFLSVPRLVEAKFGGYYFKYGRENFLSQVKVLKLDITSNASAVIHWLELPELMSLTHLEVAAYVDDGVSLNLCILLLRASPSLFKLTLKMLNAEPIFRIERKFTMEYQYSLKELELIGFCGAACEVEFVIYLIENAVDLEKITIDPNLPTDLVRQLLESRDHEVIRKRARELEKKIPPWIEFVCL